jgi:hypothetical protein
MYIICPHCRSPIELVKVTTREAIFCPSCGSCFKVEEGSTTGWNPQDRKKLGKFELLDKVGAFGTVYKARDPDLDLGRIAIEDSAFRPDAAGTFMAAELMQVATAWLPLTWIGRQYRWLPWTPGERP